MGWWMPVGKAGSWRGVKASAACLAAGMVCAACLRAGEGVATANAQPEEERVEVRAVLELAGKPLPMRWAVLGHNEPAEDWHGGSYNNDAKKDKLPFFWNPDLGKADPVWEPLTHAFPLHFLRYHCGNEYDWKKVSGPVENREPIRAHYLPKMNSNPGLDEFLQWRETLPGKPTVSLIASPLRPVEELAELVAYCNAKTGPMAERRALVGHPEPYGVTVWELGNETDWTKRKDLDIMRADTDKEKGDKITVEEYAALCIERIDAMRAVDPTIRIFSHAATGPWEEQNAKWADWHRGVLKLMGDRIDGLVVHPYYDGYTVPRVFAKTIDVILRDMEELQPKGKRLTLWLSEHSRWIDYHDKTLWPQSWGINGAISTGDFLIKTMEREQIEIANYWAYGHTGPWRVLMQTWADDGTRQVFGTATHGLFTLLNVAAREEVVPLAVKEEPGIEHPDYPYAVSAMHFRDAASRTLLVVNRSADPYRLTLPDGVRPAGNVRRLTLVALDGAEPAGQGKIMDETLPAADVLADAAGELAASPRCVQVWVWSAAAQK